MKLANKVAGVIDRNDGVAYYSLRIPMNRPLNASNLETRELLACHHCAFLDDFDPLRIILRLTRGGQIYKMDDRFLELFDEKERPCKSLRLGCISFFFFHLGTIDKNF